MKKAIGGLVLALSIGPLGFASVPELYLVSGATNHSSVGAAGVVQYSNSNFEGWNIIIAFGNSLSPTLNPYGLDLKPTAIECKKVGGCSELRIWLTDTDFTDPAQNWTIGYSDTSLKAGTSTTLKAWVGTNNNPFEADGSDGRPATGTFLGAAGPLTSTTGDVTSSVVGPTVGMGTGGPNPYSLTLEALFSGCVGTNCGAYGGDAQITGTIPEPASVALFGTVLALCASRLLKRRKVS